MASLLLIGPALAWHLDYFRSPGSEYHRLILILAPVFFGVTLAYGWLRPLWLRRAEPWLMLGMALGAPVVWRPFATAIVLALLCASVAVGRKLLDLAGFTGASRLETLVLSAGVGFGLLIPLLMLVSPGTGYVVWAFASLVLADGVLRTSAREAVAMVRAWSESAELDRPLAGIATAFAFPFLGIVLALALAPAIAHDALLLHLPAVRHYVAAGGLEALSHHSYTYFPQGGELIMAAAAAYAGLPAAQLVQPMFFALALGALVCVAARAGMSPLTRYVGAVFTVALPFLAWTGGVAKNDMAMALFQTLALLCLLAAGGERPKAWLRLGVFFVAASFSVKHTAAFGAAPLGLLYFWRLWRLEHKARELVLWAGILAIVAGSWLFRAYVLTGNPFYPVELSWAVESLRPNSMRPPEWRSIPYWKIPWTIHFDGTVAFESPSPNPSGFFLWLFAPLWLLLRRRQAQPSETLCLAFAWIYFFYWGSVWPVVRYAIVPLGLLVTLTVQRLETSWRLWAGGWRLALAAMVSLNGIACLLAAAIFSVNAPQLALFSGRIDEKEYLRRTLTSYPVTERLTEAHEAGDWILGVTLNTAAYAPDPSRFRFHPLVEGRDDDPRDIAGALTKRRYAFLVTPADADGAAILRALPASIAAERIYADEHFALDRLVYSPSTVPE